jgi:hypothetical protein
VRSIYTTWNKLNTKGESRNLFHKKWPTGRTLPDRKGNEGITRELQIPQGTEFTEQYEIICKE